MDKHILSLRVCSLPSSLLEKKPDDKHTPATLDVLPEHSPPKQQNAYLRASSPMQTAGVPFPLHVLLRGSGEHRREGVHALKKLLGTFFDGPRQRAMEPLPSVPEAREPRLKSSFFSCFSKRDTLMFFEKRDDADAFLYLNKIRASKERPEELHLPAPILAFPAGEGPRKNETSGTIPFVSWSPHLKLTQEGRIVARDRPACPLPYSPGHFPFPFWLVAPTSTNTSGSSTGRHDGGKGGEAGCATAFGDGGAACRCHGRAIVVWIAAYRHQAGSNEAPPHARKDWSAPERGRERDGPVRLCCEAQRSCLASSKCVSEWIPIPGTAGWPTM